MLAVGLLTVLTALVFHSQLFDHWTFRWDFLGSYTTTPAFVAAVIGRGQIPSWTPFVASGFPVAVDPQAGAYFPGWWLLGGLGVPATLRVLTAVQVVHVLFGSVGVLALARARRLEWTWATVAAVAYLFFGGFYGESEHADIVRGFAYIPWLLWSLTPPSTGPWTRLVALPPLVWLIATGAYPGELVSFGLTGLVYVSVALWTSPREVWIRYRVALILAVVAAAAVCIAVLLPYLRAEQAHELHRVLEPTAVVRAGESFAPRDLLGLYLNNFAWIYDGTVTAWAVGIPILIGLACVRWAIIRRQAPLMVCGAVALALATAPKIGLIGRAMASIRPLFPSRFPAADYKSVVAVALVVLAADAWSEVMKSRRGSWRVAVLGGLLLAGALLAGSTYGQATRELWLVIAVILASVALALIRMPPRLLVCLLVGLIVVDGSREINDYRFLGQLSPWRVSAAEAAPYPERDVYVRKLPAVLGGAPSSRPARVAPTLPLASSPTGSDPDATGWIGDGYHMIDYGGTIESALWQAEHNQAWSAMLLAPWHGYTFPCAVVGCDNGEVHLPTPTKWSPSSHVRTLAYGINRTVYAVDISHPALLVENELAIRGWQTSSKQVRPVNAGIPLRAWRLSPGSYTFTTSFQAPGRTLQAMIAIFALITWLGCILLVRRRRVPSTATA